MVPFHGDPSAQSLMPCFHSFVGSGEVSGSPHVASMDMW